MSFSIGTKFSVRPVGAKTRNIINIIHERGDVSRQDIYKYCSHELFPNMKHVSKILKELVRQRRVKAFLPRGSILGQDPFLYRLNPLKSKKNFPEKFGNSVCKRNLEWMKKMNTDGVLQTIIENTPLPANTKLKDNESKIRNIRKRLYQIEEEKKKL